MIDMMAVEYMSEPQRIDSRPAVLYEIYDSFPINIKHRINLSGWSPKRTAGSLEPRGILDPEFAVIISRVADKDSYCLPSMTPLACFPPIPGTGYYGNSTIRLSIIFWDDTFWCPVVSANPNREKLFENLRKSRYKDINNPTSWKLDILYKVEIDGMIPPLINKILSKDPSDDWK